MMMKVKVFTVYDSKSKLYKEPFTDVSTGSALRAFSEAVNDKKFTIGKYPSDFTLVELGEFDVQDASFSVLEHPISYPAVEYLIEPVKVG